MGKAVKALQIDEDEIRRRLEAMPPRLVRRTFGATEDKLILEYWPTRSADSIARVMGCCENTIRKRYAYLTEVRP